MIVTISVLAAAASGLFLGSGFLFGARRGVDARKNLDTERRRLAVRAQFLEARISALLNASSADAADLRSEIEGAVRAIKTRENGSVDALRTELKELQTALTERERRDAAVSTELRNELKTLTRNGADPSRMERELRRIVGPLLERQNETTGLREMVTEALEPILKQKKLGQELAALEAGASLTELPRILDAIAQKGGFSSVVLSDDVGLPLAASSNAQSVDWLAGVASLLITLIERSERSNEPRPIGVVVHDEANQRLLHRVFRVGGAQFLLTAVSRGQDVAPSALDPALGKLERALSRPQIHA